MTGKNVDTQLLFKLDDRFGDTGLGGKQGLGGFCQVEILPDSLTDKAELMEIHGLSPDATSIVFIKALKRAKNQPPCADLHISKNHISK
jgi:hypothetical protein